MRQASEENWIGVFSRFCLLYTVALSFSICYEAWKLAFWSTIILLIVLYSVYWGHKDRIRLSAIAADRGKSSICRFARQFDYRSIDTRIIREVYERVLQWVGDLGGEPFPVEADDEFGDMYSMADDDLEELALEVMKKLGRSTEPTPENPYTGRVVSLRDLVLLINHQPRMGRAAPLTGDV